MPLGARINLFFIHQKQTLQTVGSKIPASVENNKQSNQKGHIELVVGAERRQWMPIHSGLESDYSS